MIPDNTRQLMEELKTHPVVEVLGVVQASGAGGVKAGPTGDWILKFSFEAWKHSAGEVQNRTLAICKNVSKEELRAAMGQIKPFDVIRIHARVAEQNSSGSPQGLLVSLVGKDNSDTSFNRLALKLQEPVTFEDTRFGTFALNRRLNWYEAKTSWGSTRVSLILYTDDLGEIKETLSSAYLLWDFQKSWSEQIYNCAATKLIGIKNKSWLGEDEAELNAEQFKDKIELDSISVKSDGKFAFWFNDVDLFWGHSIKVSGSLSGGATDANIEG